MSHGGHNRRIPIRFDHDNKSELAWLTVAVSACHLGLLKVNVKRCPPTPAQWANELQKVPPTPPLRQTQATGLTSPPTTPDGILPRIPVWAQPLPGCKVQGGGCPLFPSPSGPAHCIAQTIPPYTSPWLQAPVWCLINICKMCLTKNSKIL